MKYLSLLLFLFSGYLLQAQKLDSLYTAYNAASEQEDYEKSEKIMTEIAELNEAYFYYYFDIAEEKFNLKQWDSTAMYVFAAIEKHSKSPMPSTEEYYANRIDCYEKGIFFFDHLIKKKKLPEDTHALLANRAILKMGIGKNIEAIVDLSELIELNPDDVTSLFNRAYAYMDLKEFKLAVDDLSTILLIHPDDGSVILNRGYAYMEDKQYGKAIEDFELAIENNPLEMENSYSYNNIGYCFYQLGDYMTAEKNVLEAIRLHPINSFAYKNLALIDLANGHVDLACENIQKSIDLGFVAQFGDEILKLQKAHCTK